MAVTTRAAILVSAFLHTGAAQPLADEIAAIQTQIVRADGAGGYYDRAYRKMEPLYWTRIPGWMREDSRKRKVGRILDIGCGYGTLLALSTEIYGAQGYCMDVTEYLKPSFAAPRHLRFARGNIELSPIPWSGKFDVVVLTEVLEHFNFQPLPTLRKIHDALGPEGVLFLSTPDARDWGRVLTYYQNLSDLPSPDPSRKIRNAHIWIYNEEEITTLLDQAGFRIERLEYARGNGNRHFNIRAIRR
jgi:SAM-dependent methyltransferase